MKQMGTCPVVSMVAESVSNVKLTDFNKNQMNTKRFDKNTKTWSTSHTRIKQVLATRQERILIFSLLKYRQFLEGIVVPA